MSIFVSIAAYRDPQLVPTIQDCLAKARYPDQLRFGVCWQHGPNEEGILKTMEDSRFRILDVEWRDSRGPCWARAEIMNLFQGEDYFLQLDSHHRFIQDWDIKLIHHAKRTKSCKPIITTYPPPFTPGEPEVFGGEPLQINFDRFTEDGIPVFRPDSMLNWQDLALPPRARFLAAGFFFTIGEFVKEVPYDPDLYFTGEEITLAIRAFTCGYDLFHPNEIIVWHEYMRKGRAKHWDDHVKIRGVEVEWFERDLASTEKIKTLLSTPYVGKFGCGTARTFQQYEAYVGISFRHRRVQDCTRRGDEPPGPLIEGDWTTRPCFWHIYISIDRDSISTDAESDFDFWYLGFHDAFAEEIIRIDLPDHAVRALLADSQPHISISQEFESSLEPATWTLWPHSRTKGWLDKIQGRLNWVTGQGTPLGRVDVGTEATDKNRKNIHRLESRNARDD